MFAGLRVAGLPEDVPCLDRGAFDLFAEGRAPFATAGATGADVAAFELLSRANSEGGALVACGAAGAAWCVAAAGTRGALTASDGGCIGGCGGPEVGAGESAATFPRGVRASTTR